jgi:hypothetical protein
MHILYTGMHFSSTSDVTVSVFRTQQLAMGPPFSIKKKSGLQGSWQ